MVGIFDFAEAEPGFNCFLDLAFVPCLVAVFEAACVPVGLCAARLVALCFVVFWSGESKWSGLTSNCARAGIALSIKNKASSRKNLESRSIVFPLVSAVRSGCPVSSGLAIQP